MNRVLGRIGLALAVIVLVALMRPDRVRAHAFLVSSSPSAGQHLRSSPPALRLQFTEAIAAVGSDHLTLQTEVGRRVPLRRLTLASGSTTLVAFLPHLASGIYLVHWQVVSADDGHPSLGEFAFAVGTGASLAGYSRNDQAPTDWLAAVVGWLFLLGLALGTGGLTSEMVIWRSLAREEFWQPPRLPILPSLLLALAGALGLFLLLAGSLRHGPASAFTPFAWSSALHTRAGIMMVLAIFFVLYALAALHLRPARTGALLALLAASAATALRSHPVATTAWWAAPAIVVHVVLAVLWTGMLAQLVLVFWRHRGTVPGEVLLAAVGRYVSLALWSVSLVLLSGLAVAFAELGSPDELFTSPYGRVLLLKGVLVIIALSLALVGRAILSDHGPERALSLLPLTTRPEVLTAIAVLALAALLSNIAPPYTAPNTSTAAANVLLGPPPPVDRALTMAGKAGWLEVYLTASANQLTIRVVTPNDEVPRTVDLHLAAERPHTAQGIDLFPRPCGSGCYSMPFRWLPGPTRLRLRVNTREWRGGSLSFIVPWPPLPPHGQLLGKVIARMQAQPSLLLTERTSSTPNTSFAHTWRASGRQFVASEPYTARVSDVRPLPSRRGLRQLVLYLSGSDIWVHLWIDDQDRVRREVIVDPGHLIQRTLSYP